MMWTRTAEQRSVDVEQDQSLWYQSLYYSEVSNADPEYANPAAMPVRSSLSLISCPAWSCCWRSHFLAS